MHAHGATAHPPRGAATGDRTRYARKRIICPLSPPPALTANRTTAFVRTPSPPSLLLRETQTPLGAALLELHTAHQLIHSPSSRAGPDGKKSVKLPRSQLSRAQPQRHGQADSEEELAVAVAVVVPMASSPWSPWPWKAASIDTWHHGPPDGTIHSQNTFTIRDQ